MDYTSSNSYATDGATAQRMHLQAQAVPTAVSDTDLNGLIWEALAAIKAGGLVPAAFDKTVPASYTQLRDAIAIAVRLQSAAYAVAGGTADALTGTYTPVVPALVNGLTLYVRAASTNATTTPNFAPNGLVAKTIVKGNNLPLVAGDIAGAGHWIELQYDSTLDKWVLLNPATGVSTTGRLVNVQVFSGNGTYTPSSSRVSKIIVEAVGGGGAGGGAVATSSNSSAGGGGGAGAYAKVMFAGTPGTTVVTIGAAGAGVSGGSGGAGGSTSFGALLSVGGGAGGYASAAGTVYPVSGAPASGSSTISSSGVVLCSSGGGAGQWGLVMTLGSSALGGMGGSSILGAGGSWTGTGLTGNSAVGRGAGGSGACNSSTGAAQVGGAGVAGLVIVYEYE
ncbi:hypothetical protein [Rhodoferax sp.]|uniref:hypothetical protein n=1 Tax=Rhodoferax sp. TaxID=50421 RepID=UPI00284AECC8|nr:hypothetical protein [Rhodoferax sp.]MDR3370727.1 hypothetical protein [Rhodoferax sp.]